MKRYLVIEYDPNHCGLETDGRQPPVSEPTLFDYVSNEFEAWGVVADLHDYPTAGGAIKYLKGAHD